MAIMMIVLLYKWDQNTINQIVLCRIRLYIRDSWFCSNNDDSLVLQMRPKYNQSSGTC